MIEKLINLKWYFKYKTQKIRGRNKFGFSKGIPFYLEYCSIF